jgi:hypothetical protein
MRTCACGCGLPITSTRANARYATDACKSRAWRAATGYRLAATRKRVRHGKSGPSGLQLPYARMVRALIAEYRDLNLPNAEARAVEMVRRQLSDRQRATLDERSTG